MLPRRERAAVGVLIQGCMDGREGVKFMCREGNTALESTGSEGRRIELTTLPGQLFLFFLLQLHPNKRGFDRGQRLFPKPNRNA